MRKCQVRLTTLVKKCFAFGELLREGEKRLKTAFLLEDEDMEDGKIPDRYEGNVPGYANIPDGFFRIEQVVDGSDVADGSQSSVQSETPDLANRITVALGQLDSDRDDHWTSDGSPRMDVVCELVGEKVTKSEVEDAEPGFKREPTI